MYTLILRLFAILFILGLFLKGFFPLKKSRDLKSGKNGLSRREKIYSDLENGPDIDLDVKGNLLQASATTEVKHEFEDTRNFSDNVFLHNNFPPRVILMVIDAFREDFAYGPLRFMPLTHDILNKGKGLKFTAETMPPTVTLPRIKVSSSCSIT